MSLLFSQPHYQELHQQRLAIIDERLAPLNQSKQELQRALQALPAAAFAQEAPALKRDIQALEHEIWLLQRQRGISGSNIATLMGLNKWQTPYQLWAHYTTLEPSPVSMEQEERFAWGHRLEPVIANAYAERMHVNVFAPPLAQCKEYPFLLASLDRVLVDPQNQPYKVLEIKTAARNYASDDEDENGLALQAWGRGNIYDRDGTLLEQDSQVPQAYYLQVMHYMLVSEIHSADIAVLLNGNDLRIFTIDYDESIAADIVTCADEFWCRHVLDNQAPSMVESDAKTLIPEPGKTVEATADIKEQFAELKAVDAQLSELKDKKQSLRDAITSFIGDGECLTYGGEKLATYKMQRGRASFDSARFKFDHPELYESYMKEGEPFRVLRSSRTKSSTTTKSK